MEKMRAKQAPIRASEIGNYLYCQRSWWYQRQGFASENVQELARGNREHAQHGSGFRRSRQLRVLAFLLLSFAVLLFALQFIA